MNPVLFGHNEEASKYLLFQPFGGKRNYLL